MLTNVNNTEESMRLNWTEVDWFVLITEGRMLQTASWFLHCCHVYLALLL